MRRPLTIPRPTTLRLGCEGCSSPRTPGPRRETPGRAVGDAFDFASWLADLEPDGVGVLLHPHFTPDSRGYSVSITTSPDALICTQGTDLSRILCTSSLSRIGGMPRFTSNLLISIHFCRIASCSAFVRRIVAGIFNWSILTPVNQHTCMHVICVDACKFNRIHSASM